MQPYFAIVYRFNSLRARNPWVYTDYYSFTDPRRTEDWVGLCVADQSDS